MSKRNVAKFHKLLELKETIKNCSKILNVSVDALKKFTPAKLEAFKAAEAERLAKLAAAQAETDAAAETLVKAAKNVTKTAKKD